MSGKFRGLIITLVCFAGAGLLAAIALYALNTALQKEKHKLIITMLNQSEAVLDHFYALERSGKLSRAEAQSEAEQVLLMLHSGDTYYFVRDSGNRFLVHIDPRRLGKVDDGGKSPDGEMTVVESYNQALLSGHYAFAVALARHAGGEKRVSKLNGVYRYTPWGWVVGTGLFIDDVQTTLWHDLIALLGIGMVLAVVVVGDRSKKAGAPGKQKMLASQEMRYALLNKIEELLAVNDWTPVEAGRLCGLTRARLDDLRYGRSSRFSLDTLVNIAAALEQHAQSPDGLTLK